MINPWLDTVVLWIHILAAISWVGGMIFVAFIVGPYVRRAFPPEQRTPLFAEIGKRFSYLGWSAIITLVCTGVYNAVRFLPSWDAFWHTTFGHILLAKISIVGVMICLSLIHDFFLGPRQRDLGKSLRRQLAPAGNAQSAPVDKSVYEARIRRIRRWTVLIAQANLLLAIVVILLAASLQSF